MDKVRLPDGNSSSREVVDHPGGVTIIPKVDKDDESEEEFLLVKQYRYPVEKELWEFPAGKLDPGETSLECAKRELEEETGYGGGKWEKKTDLYTSPGYSNEVLTLFYASGVKPVDPKDRIEGPEKERIIVKSFTFTSLIEMVKEGDLRDGKTLAGLFFLFNKGN
mgnify:CR=1 FL=1